MMNERTLEPSAFALDAYFAAGSADDATLGRHIAGCMRCAAYLAELERLGLEPAPALALGARTPRPSRSRAVAAWLAAMAVTAIAAAVWVRLSTSPQPDYVASKGVPAVQVLIRSEGQSRLWDGKSKLGAGDAIALHAGCERYTHLAVAVLTRRARQPAWSRVFDGACRPSDAPLPFSLVADDTPGNERIGVVFSQSRLDDEALDAALQRTERSDAVWVAQVSLQKEVSKP